MRRYSIWPFIWIAYMVISIMFVVVFPRYYPHFGNVGFFLPFFFFFPFFRRGRRRRPNPVPASQSMGKRDNDASYNDYSFEDMLNESNRRRAGPPSSVYYIAGIAVVIIGTLALLIYAGYISI